MTTMTMRRNKKRTVKTKRMPKLKVAYLSKLVGRSLTYAVAPPSKKRKLDTADDATTKKSQKTADTEDKDVAEDDSAPEDSADEQEQEDDEPAVKTKVIKESESKIDAKQAESEEYEKE